MRVGGARPPPSTTFTITTVSLVYLATWTEDGQAIPNSVYSELGNVQKTHVVELEFFQIFLPYSFRLIGPLTKQGLIHPW